MIDGFFSNDIFSNKVDWICQLDFHNLVYWTYCSWLLGTMGISSLSVAILLLLLFMPFCWFLRAFFCAFVDVVLKLWYQDCLFYSKRGWLSWPAIRLKSSRERVHFKYRAVWNKYKIVLSAHTIWKLPISEITLLTMNTKNMMCTPTTHSTERV